MQAVIAQRKQMLAYTQGSLQTWHGDYEKVITFLLGLLVPFDCLFKQLRACWSVLVKLLNLRMFCRTSAVFLRLVWAPLRKANESNRWIGPKRRRDGKQASTGCLMY